MISLLSGQVIRAAYAGVHSPQESDLVALTRACHDRDRHIAHSFSFLDSYSWTREVESIG